MIVLPGFLGLPGKATNPTVPNTVEFNKKPHANRGYYCIIRVWDALSKEELTPDFPYSTKKSKRFAKPSSPGTPEI
jgi:hypothetical protein